MPKRRVSEETRTLCLQDQPCAYQLKRSSARRTLALSVGQRGLIVHAPWQLAQSQIDVFMQEKAAWILAKLQYYSTRLSTAWEWRNGMVLRYLGDDIRLDVSTHSRAIVMMDGVLHVPTLSVKKILGWYQRAALGVFQQRLAVFAPRLDKQPVLCLSNARTRWGSCTSTGVVRLHWRLVQASLAEIDYVLAHELAHLTHMNHSPQFWQRVADLYPGYQQPHQQLRQHGHLYHQMVLTELS
ncbi:MAG: SprT family zinc-dependent metalloprotease [Sulfuriferula sp.]